MSLFKCGCGAVENTALGDYWGPVMDRKPPRCSKCFTGKWHDMFPRQTPEESGLIEGRDGFWYKPEEIAPGGSMSHVTGPKQPLSPPESENGRE